VGILESVTTESTRWLSADQQRSWRGLLMGTALLLNRLDSDLDAEFGLSMAEYEILVRLSENDGQLRMAQLANSMAHSRSRITHTVARMERAGLVERRTSKSDGRGVVATLTPKGFELLERAAHVHVTGVREHLLDLVSDDDFAALGRAMNTVADHLLADGDTCDIR